MSKMTNKKISSNKFWSHQHFQSTFTQWSDMLEQNLVSSQSIVTSLNHPNNSSAVVIDILTRLLCEAREPDRPDQQKIMFNEFKKVILQFMNKTSISTSASNSLRFNFSLLKDLVECSRLVSTSNATPSLFRSSSQVEDLLLHHHYLLNGNIFEFEDRYTKDFIEEDVIGKGGFGIVVRARHIIDRCTYAIKKVLIREKSAATQLMLEAQALASLDHPNIVRYHNAWLQPYLPGPKSPSWFGSNSSPDISLEDDSFISSGERFVDIRGERDSEDFLNGTMNMIPPILKMKHLRLESNSNDSDIQFYDSKENKEQLSSEEDFEEEEDDSDSNQEILNGGAGALIPYHKRRKSSQSMMKQTLFIQMSLCGKSLESYLKKRNFGFNTQYNLDIWSLVNTSMMTKIVFDILSALKYIHSQGIIHRDLKPGNILLSLDGKKALLSDFGLIRPHFEESFPFPANSSSTINPLISKGVGTPPYMAPEVEQGIYSYKSDMYGFGIVLYELFHPFKTSSERVHQISELKKGKINPELNARWRPLAKLISSLTNSSPQLRPTAEEVLNAIDHLSGTGESRYDSSLIDSIPDQNYFAFKNQSKLNSDSHKGNQTSQLDLNSTENDLDALIEERNQLLIRLQIVEGKIKKINSKQK